MKRNLTFLLALLMLITSLPALADSSVFVDTPLAGSTRARLENIRLAVDAINGTRVPYGEYFSFNDLVGPRTPRYGYQSAINGRGVKVTGGGVAQVASTIYLALKELGDGIYYDEKQTYGRNYNGKYVERSSDAILVEYGNVDFCFTNEYSTFDIQLYIAGDSLCCELLLRGTGRAISTASFEIDGNRATRTNVTLAADSIYDTQLTHGDVFSFNDIVGPRTAKYGFKNALNGRGVTVSGGGVAQVASAIYLAVNDMSSIKITKKSTYGSNYTQSYVERNRDAILVDYAGKIDFQFEYIGHGMLSIAPYVDGQTLVCDIYEVED